MSYVTDTDLAGTAPGQGAMMVGFKQPASAATTRSAAAKLEEQVSIEDFGASPSLSDNKFAIEAAVAAAMASGRSVYIPPNVYQYSQIDFKKNSDSSPQRLVLWGPGTLKSTFAGVSIISSQDYFYDLVFDRVRFESTHGAGTKLIDGAKFIRLLFTPGSQIKDFDWVIYAETGYLQSVRMIATIVRGGAGAVVKAPLAYDCRFTHNIIEFATDGIVIDGDGDPAVHSCTISDNVIEGMAGRGIAVGACLSTTICGNYMEGNAGGEIFLNASSSNPPALHKGLRVQNNSLQQTSDRLGSHAYSIVWGQSLGLPARAGGNFSTGNLHDLTGATSLLDTIGDVVSAGRHLTTPDVGRRLSSDGLGLNVDWFTRAMRLDPYAQEVVFAGKNDSTIGGSNVPPVITFGTNSPGNDSGQFERKTWARGSIVFNSGADSTGDAVGWICLIAGTPGTWSFFAIVP